MSVIVLALVIVAATGARGGLAVNGAVFVQLDPGSNATGALQELASVLGPGGWVSFVVEYGQATVDSTVISATRGTLSRAQLAALVGAARRLGLRTAVKPHVDLTADPQHWRGQIGANFSAAEWEQWFAEYESVVLAPLAAAAEEVGADLFVAGTELSATQPQEAHWRSALARVRSLFGGRLTYGANHGDEGSVGWWDAVDWIGVDAYYPLGSDGSLPALEAAWRQLAQSVLAPLAAKFSRPILFSEVGYEALSGAAATPWHASGTLSPAAQSRCYLALYRALAGQPWFLGPLWWALSDSPEDGGALSPGFSFRNKPAAAVVSWQGDYP